MLKQSYLFYNLGFRSSKGKNGTFIRSLCFRLCVCLSALCPSRSSFLERVKILSWNQHQILMLAVPCSCKKSKLLSERNPRIGPFEPYSLTLRRRIKANRPRVMKFSKKVVFTAQVKERFRKLLICCSIYGALGARVWLALYWLFTDFHWLNLYVSFGLALFGIYFIPLLGSYLVSIFYINF